jgi:hypothetical protein
MVSCREKFNGKSEETFTASRYKIEQELNSDEKINLEKALRVIALEAMGLKWEKPEKYKGKSFNEISLNMVDGLSYSSAIRLAENILKDENKKKIDKLTQEINTLNLQKSEIVNNRQKLDLFKIDYLTLDNTKFFGEMVPELAIGYKYIGKDDLHGAIEILYEVRQKSTDTVIASTTVTSGDDESVIKTGKIMDEYLILSYVKENNPQLWSKAKYPVENLNLADYDLELKVEVVSLFLNGVKIEMPKAKIEDIEDEIKNKQWELDDLKTRKGTLDELELSDN